MKRSDFYIKVITAVLFIAVVGYIGVYAFNAAMDTLETATAVNFSVDLTFPARGYIVRSETVISDLGPLVLPIVGEGEKVASGQTVAVEYMSVGALDAAREIRELRSMIARLEASYDGAGVEAVGLESVLNLSKAVWGGDLSRLDELSLIIETTIFTESSALLSGLPDMKARLESLEARDSVARTIDTPVSGTFSHFLDGFEHVGPDALDGLTPDGLSELFYAPSRVSGFGKMITEFKWFYAAVMDAADVLRFSEGGQITLRFSDDYNASMDMVIERVGRPEGGECVVVFSSYRSIHELAPYRALSADVIYDVVSGIRIPKEAIHLDDDGTAFVFLKIGVHAERVNVDILVESGDGYLVRDSSGSGTSLHSGSVIIVKGNNLYDGKIVA